MVRHLACGLPQSVAARAAVALLVLCAAQAGASEQPPVSTPGPHFPDSILPVDRIPTAPDALWTHDGLVQVMVQR